MERLPQTHDPFGRHTLPAVGDTGLSPTEPQPVALAAASPDVAWDQYLVVRFPPALPVGAADERQKAKSLFRDYYLLEHLTRSRCSRLGALSKAAIADMELELPLVPVLAPTPRVQGLLPQPVAQPEALQSSATLQYSGPTNSPGWLTAPPGVFRGANLQQRSRVTDRRCKVPGCTVVLQDPSLAADSGTGKHTCRYSWRLRVCDAHRRATVVPWPGQEPKRWCQVRS